MVAIDWGGLESGPSTKLLGSRAAVRTILDWRRGRRKAPVWAIERLQEELRRQRDRASRSIEELEKEKPLRLPHF
jgi:hypothetical protein